MLQLLLIDKKLKDVHSVLSATGGQIEALGPSVAHKESLKVFFLVLQVCHYLMGGQVNTTSACGDKLGIPLMYIKCAMSAQYVNHYLFPTVLETEYCIYSINLFCYSMESNVHLPVYFYID